MDRKKVLIVEDDQDILRGMEIALSREFETCTATDGVTARMAIRREAPDIIALDIGLPGGDGLTMLDWLADSPEHTAPVVVITGRCDRATEERALELGAHAVLQKPVMPSDLRAIFDEALAEASVRRPHVLVVEDHADTLASMRTALRGAGCCVSTAGDGVTAVSVARRTMPDVVLLDLGLPCGGGERVVERLRALPELATVPIVVISGVDPTEARLRTGDAATSYLHKPARPWEVTESVLSVL